MATDSAAASVNGTYGSQQPYAANEAHPSTQTSNNTAGSTTSGPYGAQNGNVPSTTSNAPSGTEESSNSVSKDEVGWYFVEQYYTTLSRSPEKLHLFYSKRSQFVSGVEAEKVTVSVGQRAINERIKELDIQDCKVRVSNVDSQESYRNLVVQVIGEMSNKAAPHRKFVQTFVLAEQPNGYFVLNDIFRYINEEEEEIEPEPITESEAPAPAAPEAEIKTLSSSDDLAAQQHDAEQVDKKLEEQVTAAQGSKDEDATDVPTTNGVADPVAAEADVAEDVPAAESVQPENELEIAPETTETDVPVEAVEQEKPKDPDPTPVASPPKAASATPVQEPTPAAPPKPTWANLVAANRIAPPAVPSPASSTSPAPSQPKAAPAPPKQVIGPPTPASDESPSQVQQGSGAEWQTAGQESGKRQSRGQSVSGAGDNQNVLGYVKNVTDKVDASILKNTLLQYGKLAYFDVSRQKNCAFVEFADAAGYNAAVAANPHSIGGEQIYVEERRPRPTAYGGGYSQNRGGMRGGRGGPDGRPGSQGRGGFQKDGGRGGFTPRGRGGNMTPRGRGQPQAV
ncbi:MAG: hypothetical protein LQ347_006468 [Umbilicaria vellea]|nr:MAG: hypothetical protein LQ347_006468 [Umbilicaria vellea]